MPAAKALSPWVLIKQTKKARFYRLPNGPAGNGTKTVEWRQAVGVIVNKRNGDIVKDPWRPFRVHYPQGINQ